ncbi:Hypothetical protein LBF_4054 [Leptospira biflexa serovar Patoc strain 'Patoc 1 (Ames)']|jgi:hypothetical protein|uniref:Uncharacterized protein n=2 Tax=Leptospira biflexa TaxID=172 RepID=B0STQ9_LEPBP|nr:hypothetical protein [Leptospira biflexa]ABZ95879.1 Hypothetical protein LBF_4054 [Leptospira biflexa serovar Patoc strain 'Patoc 1 (Ames)']ABZ99593.1 Hypothetical protein LEPBI_II0055 [Leptospira biflexa serovar Patoc strain 'Patoc 1 (Paris)']TGM51750.1 hypothetical protein EHQ91_17215 [Leptospira biflexa]
MEQMKMNACILYLNNKRIEMIKLESDHMESKTWEKPLASDKWDFAEITKTLDSPSEVILVGESGLNMEYRRWLANHDRVLAKKLIAVIGGTLETKISPNLVSHFKEKYFRNRG